MDDHFMLDVHRQYFLPPERRLPVAAAWAWLRFVHAFQVNIASALPHPAGDLRYRYLALDLFIEFVLFLQSSSATYPLAGCVDLITTTTDQFRINYQLLLVQEGNDTPWEALWEVSLAVGWAYRGNIYDDVLLAHRRTATNRGRRSFCVSVAEESAIALVLRVCPSCEHFLLLVISSHRSPVLTRNSWGAASVRLVGHNHRSLTSGTRLQECVSFALALHPCFRLLVVRAVVYFLARRDGKMRDNPRVKVLLLRHNSQIAALREGGPIKLDERFSRGISV